MPRITFPDAGLGEHVDWMLTRPEIAAGMGAFSEAVYNHSTLPTTERERRAAEFAERFALDHLAMDDEFWGRMRASFSDEEIAATGADYLALGHWDRPMRVGNGAVPAYYSGSPDLAGTINLVRLTADGVIVRREKLIWPD